MDNIKTEILMDMINILADFLVITIDLFNNDYELIGKKLF